MKEVRCQGAIEVVRLCTEKGRKNGPCQDSLGLNIQTDHVIEHRQPDVVVLDKHEKILAI